LFRSLLVPLHLLSQLSPARLILLTPLYFGIAHIHHFYEYSLTHPHTPLLPALVRSLVQFAYTTVFGWYATFIFLRTASVPAVVLAHSFCNWCGLPRLWGRVGDDDDDEQRKLHGKATVLGIGWTMVYYTLLLAGAVSFRRGLWPLTNSKHALATVD
jgi:prenyl protein peptidase